MQQMCALAERSQSVCRVAGALLELFNCELSTSYLIVLDFSSTTGFVKVKMWGSVATQQGIHANPAQNSGLTG